MNFDFVEIGTADFDTLAESAPEGSIGLSVEPVPEYIDRLPERVGLIKLQGAVVSSKGYVHSLPVYYVPEDIIAAHGLGHWMKGCNSVGKPHDFHTMYYHNPTEWHSVKDNNLLPKRDLVAEGLVKIFNAPCFTWKMLVEFYDIEYVKHVKTDVEGLDVDLVTDIVEYYKSTDLTKLPQLIQFEDNAHSDPVRMKETKALLESVGYFITDENSHFHGNAYANLGSRVELDPSTGRLL